MIGIKPRILQWLGIVLIVQIGLFHIINAQAEYEEAAYMGYLFAANFFGALIAALGIQRRQVWAWALGLVIAAGSLVGFLWSRTLGMPGMGIEEWETPYGLVSMALEGLFIGLALLHLGKSPTKPVETSAGQPKGKILWRLGGLAVMLALTFFTYRWDDTVTQAYGLHVNSAEVVSGTAVTSMAALEEQYGVEVSLVATSMMGSIVDVRLKIIDPQKANILLQNQAAVLVEGEDLIVSPHMHSHSAGRLKAGKAHIIFFPTQQKIHPGTQVNLVFGPVRIASVVVQ
jgi:hypothetical protein